jgi:hypothetical protein
MNNFLKRFSVIILIVLLSCDPISKLYVKFGEVKPVLEKRDDDAFTIFFDREGTIYPDLTLSDSLIKYYDSRLQYLYQNEPTILKNACLKSHVSESSSFTELQTKIIEEKASEINRNANGKQIVFMIHGFNKHPLLPDSASSSHEFMQMRDTLKSKYSNTNFYFVEIYWDGCSWVNGKKSREALNTFKIWNNAEAASNLVGLELRRILSKINHDTTWVITHSLGASVITCALFNVDKFKEGKFRQNLMKKCKDTVNYKTPIKEFKIGMLAPAIPGDNSFDEFKNRTPPNSIIYNYRFVIGYNIYDPALTKKIGIPKHFGATSLGCLYSEVLKVENRINKTGDSIIMAENFSYRKDSSRQKIHDFSEYIKNDLHMKEFLRKLFE